MTRPQRKALSKHQVTSHLGNREAFWDGSGVSERGQKWPRAAAGQLRRRMLSPAPGSASSSLAGQLILTNPPPGRARLGDFHGSMTCVLFFTLPALFSNLSTGFSEKVTHMSRGLGRPGKARSSHRRAIGRRAGGGLGLWPPQTRETIRKPWASHLGRLSGFLQSKQNRDIAFDTVTPPSEVRKLAINSRGTTLTELYLSSFLINKRLRGLWEHFFFFF